MTHVFVAPHPDDVALSCGGLIASLRELGQNVTIVTVFSGNAEVEDLTAYQREALGFGSKTMWPASEAFNRAAIAADFPDEGPAWAATEEAARGHPGRRRCRGQALLAALVVVSPGEHPQRVARRPAGHRRPVDPGRRPDRGDHRGGRGRRPDGAPPHRGRALRLLRRGGHRVPRPARCGLSRLRGRRPAAGQAARRRHRAVRHPAAGDRPPRAAEGVPAAGHRRPCRPPAVPRRRGGAAQRVAGAG